ncbi:MAG: superoxide dismutase [Brevundimonas sp.]
MTAPAFAQDSTAPQTPPAPAQAAPPAAEQPAGEPATLTLQPGSNVMGSDGTVLGQLEGARNGAAGQELTVRGADGQLRAVPVSGGVRQEGEGVAVGWTSAQFSAAPSIADSSSDVAEPAASPMEGQPASPATPATPATPPAQAEPVSPPMQTPPTLPPANDPADPPPGEGQTPEPDGPDA